MATIVPCRGPCSKEEVAEGAVQHARAWNLDAGTINAIDVLKNAFLMLCAEVDDLKRRLDERD